MTPGEAGWEGPGGHRFLDNEITVGRRHQAQERLQSAMDLYGRDEIARGTIFFVAYLTQDAGQPGSIDPLSDLIPGVIHRLSRLELADPCPGTHGSRRPHGRRPEPGHRRLARPVRPPRSRWRHPMATGMFSRSTPAATDLSAPQEGSRLADFCRETGMEEVTELTPIPCETFVHYGTWFAHRYVGPVDAAGPRPSPSAHACLPVRWGERP
ncbi:hypothetical protein ACFXKI_52210 [Streptomyces mirabilis]|uniref:hypothetical protein n=1 Tax=Streptomyces mirabilis TaxID=68239 RepID=UPI0036CD8BE3